MTFIASTPQSCGELLAHSSLQVFWSQRQRSGNGGRVGTNCCAAPLLRCSVFSVALTGHQPHHSPHTRWRQDVTSPCVACVVEVTCVRAAVCRQSQRAAPRRIGQRHPEFPPENCSSGCARDHHRTFQGSLTGENSLGTRQSKTVCRFGREGCGRAKRSDQHGTVPMHPAIAEATRRVAGAKLLDAALSGGGHSLFVFTQHPGQAQDR